MHGRLSNNGLSCFEQVSGAQSGFAVRSAGDLPETASTKLMKHHSLEKASV
jgi:hypothetical protein